MDNAIDKKRNHSRENMHVGVYFSSESLLKTAP